MDISWIYKKTGPFPTAFTQGEMFPRTDQCLKLTRKESKDCLTEYPELKEVNCLSTVKVGTFRQYVSPNSYTDTKSNPIAYVKFEVDVENQRLELRLQHTVSYIFTIICLIYFFKLDLPKPGGLPLHSIITCLAKTFFV